MRVEVEEEKWEIKMREKLIITGVMKTVDVSVSNERVEEEKNDEVRSS